MPVSLVINSSFLFIIYFVVHMWIAFIKVLLNIGDMGVYTHCVMYVYRHCKLCFQNVFLSTICLLGYYMNIYNECGNCAMNSVTGDTIFLTEVYIWSWFPSSCIFELCDDINVQILTLSWCHLSLRWTSYWIKKESSISISIIMF